MNKQIINLRAVAFHLETINKAQKNVASKLDTSDTFQRGMKAGYVNTTDSMTPYIEELTQLVAELTEMQPYMVDDLTYEGVEESA